MVAGLLLVQPAVVLLDPLSALRRPGPVAPRSAAPPASAPGCAPKQQDQPYEEQREEQEPEREPAAVAGFHHVDHPRVRRLRETVVHAGVIGADSDRDPTEDHEEQHPDPERPSHVVLLSTSWINAASAVCRSCERSGEASSTAGASGGPYTGSATPDNSIRGRTGFD